MTGKALTSAGHLRPGDRVQYSGLTHTVFEAEITGDHVQLRLAADAMSGSHGRQQRLLVRENQMFKVVLPEREMEAGAGEGVATHPIRHESYLCSVVGVMVDQTVYTVTGKLVQCSGSAVCGVTRKRGVESWGFCVWGGE